MKFFVSNVKKNVAIEVTAATIAAIACGVFSSSIIFEYLAVGVRSLACRPSQPKLNL